LIKRVASDGNEKEWSIKKKSGALKFSLNCFLLEALMVSDYTMLDT